MNDKPKAQNEVSAMVKVAAFIVDKRNLFFLLLIIGLIFSAFSTSWVQVENSLPEYLPDDSESRQGLDVMAEQFITYGTTSVMVENVSLDRAETLYDELCAIDGVQSIVYLENEDYNNVSALYEITFDYSETDNRCLETLDSVKEHLPMPKLTIPWAFPM